MWKAKYGITCKFMGFLLNEKASCSVLTPSCASLCGKIQLKFAILILDITARRQPGNSLISRTGPIRERTLTGAQHFASFKGGKSGRECVEEALNCLHVAGRGG